MRAARDEWKAKYGDDSLFDMYDLDGDGIIDADEFIAGQVGVLAYAGHTQAPPCRPPRRLSRNWTQMETAKSTGRNGMPCKCAADRPTAGRWNHSVGSGMALTTVLMRTISMGME